MTQILLISPQLSYVCSTLSLYAHQCRILFGRSQSPRISCSCLTPILPPSHELSPTRCCPSLSTALQLALLAPVDHISWRVPYSGSWLRAKVRTLLSLESHDTLLDVFGYLGDVLDSNFLGKLRKGCFFLFVICFGFLSLFDSLSCFFNLLLELFRLDAAELGHFEFLNV